MAKRTRASRSAHRPGGLGPSRTKRTGTDEAGSTTPAETEVDGAEDIGASYSEVDVDEVAAAAVAAATTATTEPATEPASGRRSRRRAARSSKRRGHDDLAVREAAETAWVRADLRRIAVVSAVLIAALAVCYLLFGVLDVLGIY